MSSAIKRPLSNMTKLEAEKASAKQAETLSEKIDTLGQENETKGAKWVIEEGKKTRQEEDEKKAEVQWKLHDAKDQIFTYGNLLLKELRRMMMDWSDEIPLDFQWFAIKNEKGLVIWFRDFNRTWYAKGMKISNIPKYDLNGIQRLVLRSLDIMDAIDRKKNPIEEDKIITA